MVVIKDASLVTVRDRALLLRPEVRRRYAPKPRPGVRDRWSPGLIVAALRTWTAEAGTPPRRQDWTGETPAGAATSGAQRKWMQEHPRWPSSSCVVDHFGSWSAALTAAGLPVRSLVFATTVAERVEAARELTARGYRPRDIAAELGVSVSSVYSYLRAGICPDCGGPVTSRGAERCSACAAGEPTVERTWTRPQVRAAIRAWTREHGSAPTYRDWTPCLANPGVWEAESPRWPSAAAVTRLYAGVDGPWNAALRDAGHAPKSRSWSDADVRDALAAFWARNGRPPRGTDLESPAWDGPCLRTLRRRYGSLDEAWSHLAPVPANPAELRRAA